MSQDPAASASTLDMTQELRQLVHRVLLGLMQQATDMHRLGRLADARDLYLAVLGEQPDHADANHNLGAVLIATGDPQGALAHFKAALTASPGLWQYWISYVDALIHAGQRWSAVEVLEDARRAGLSAEAIGEMLDRLLAEQLPKQSPTQRPPGGGGDTGVLAGADVVALAQLVNQGDFAALEHKAGTLAQRCPGNPLGWRMLGLALLSQGRDQEAVPALRSVAELCPEDAGNLNTLGLALIDRGRLLEAEFAFRQAIGVDSSHVAAHSNLGMALERQGRLQQAREVLLRCIALDAHFHVAYLNLSVVLDGMGLAGEADMQVRRALELRPDFVHAHNSLGYLLKDQGRIEEAEASIRRALALDPFCAAAHSNLLFVLNYHPDLTAEQIFQAYREFDVRRGVPLRTQWRTHTNSRQAGRRLKVGYVCPTFSNHSTRHFLQPLLAHHDHADFEIVAYSELLSAPDAATARYRDHVDAWVATAGMTDEALAERIRADGIDVLVDIAGHTRGNRLEVFARKPAPVSLHWLDFGYTTGLTAIDYYLTDQATAPPGSEALFAETPWRLPVPAFAYRPADSMGDVSPLPAATRGYVTFGTLTRAIRINHHTIRVWSDILRRVAGARLVIDSSNFQDPASCDALAQKFLAHGIGRDRLEIGCHSPPWDVLRGIDIGLDCFPHNSGTTLFEMLYLGIPFVTLAGRPSVGRLGSAILQGIACPQWIADSEASYVEKVVALASDQPGLQAVRSGLRARMQNSALMDEAGFARHVEDAYRAMFDHWRGQALDAAPPSEGPAPPTQQSPATDTLEAMLQRASHKVMELALADHRAGRLQAAQDGYRAILDLAPAHPDAHHNLAVILLEAGDATASLPHFRAALQTQPDHWPYWLSCFDALLHAHEPGTATEMLEHKRRSGLSTTAMAELIERLVESRFACDVLQAQARQASSGEPVASQKPTRSTKPARAPAARQVDRIEALFRLHRLDEVVALATAMTQRHRQTAFGWKALGAALVNLGRFAESLHPLQMAVQCAPRDAGALSNLGFALQNQRRPVEAEVNLRLALKYRPEFASALINLGAAVLSQDRYEEAAQLYRRGLVIEPSYIPAHSHLAQVHDEQGRLVEAAAGFRRTLELLETSQIDLKAARFDVTQAHAHQGLCSVCAKLADFDQVVAQADAALAVLPDDPVIWEKRLYAFSYHPDLPVAAIFSEFVRWGDRFPPPDTDFSGHDRTRARRLKVGYVSPDFRRHTSRFYFLPFFANHDHAVVEIFAYSNVKVEDEFSTTFRRVFDHWRDIRECSDEEVAALVRADGIDILVDGCNHMRDDRLGVFALKPAPLQVTWLGAAWTTGLKAVDYVLFDPYIAPPQTVARENIVRLPHCFVPFQALTDTDLPAPPPCIRNGYVTFGYSGRTERLNHHTFRVWGEILRRMPTAQLVLDFRHFADPLNRAHFQALIERHGLGPERVVMRNSSNIFKGLHDFDILLDCFPHSGGTMLVDALWMGVPALTLAARPPLGRIGTTFMTNIGLPQWVAASEDEYIDKACRFAADTAGLVALRAGMRERMLASPLMDGRGFARGVESAYRTMWERFCAGEAPSPLTVPGGEHTA